MNRTQSTQSALGWCVELQGMLSETWVAFRLASVELEVGAVREAARALRLLAGADRFDESLPDETCRTAGGRRSAATREITPDAGGLSGKRGEVPPEVGTLEPAGSANARHRQASDRGGIALTARGGRPRSGSGSRAIAPRRSPRGP